MYISHWDAGQVLDDSPQLIAVVLKAPVLGWESDEALSLFRPASRQKTDVLAQ